MKAVNEKNTAIDPPPWGSKGRLNRAGASIRQSKELILDEASAFEEWRAAHSYVLNTFKPLLWSRVKGKKIVVAQRLKRRTTIIDKLFREPKMELARMDDIAGCRLIFDNLKNLNKFRAEFHEGKFNHKLRHTDKEKYNYIVKPKSSGYRGIHEIYIYEVNSDEGKKFNGLFIEMQFRTLPQHAWATAVEVVSRITENQPKFNRGDKRHNRFFQLASELIARSAEQQTSCLPTLSDNQLKQQFQSLDDEINVIRFLRNIPIIEQTSRFKNNIVLQTTNEKTLLVHEYSTIDAATEGYFLLEKKFPNDDIVLVRAKSFDAIRSAYRNYFQNTNEFLKYIDDAMK